MSAGVTSTVPLTLLVKYGSPILLPGGSLTVPNLMSGSSFTYTGTLTQLDAIALVQTGNPCAQSGGQYCTNGAGVVVVPGLEPVGAAATFGGTFGTTSGSWDYGALLMSVSGAAPIGTVQLFPANSSNGLGDPNPPAGLTLPQTSLEQLGFSAFVVTNPTITFWVASNFYGSQSGQFLLTQTPNARTR